MHFIAAGRLGATGPLLDYFDVVLTLLKYRSARTILGICRSILLVESPGGVSSSNAKNLFLGNEGGFGGGLSRHAE
jgi:hypothetical protein